MRIYLGITGTGGKVAGSFEVGEIYEKFEDFSIIRENLECWSYANINNKCRRIDRFKMFHSKKNDELLWQGWNTGWEMQNYAIEIKDFRKEKLQLIDDVATFWKWNEKDEYVTKLPQSFAYVFDPYDGEMAILTSIHQEWFDMIKSGEKKYEYRNILPIALRGE